MTCTVNVGAQGATQWIYKPKPVRPHACRWVCGVWGRSRTCSYEFMVYEIL